MKAMYVIRGIVVPSFGDPHGATSRIGGTWTLSITPSATTSRSHGSRLCFGVNTVCGVASPNLQSMSPPSDSRQMLDHIACPERLLHYHQSQDREDV